MPELPEVETTRRGIEPHLVGRMIHGVIVREFRLRQPVPKDLERITGDKATAVNRRGKYLIVELARTGSLLIHLGMSGSLRISRPTEDFRKHDHIAIGLEDGSELRYHDPRRFGIFLHLPEGNPLDHPLLYNLGPEPLSGAFSGGHLRQFAKGRKIAIKPMIMDSRCVVGVGNIYASEALFRAGIRPGVAARRLTGPKLHGLAESIQAVLNESIVQGGTTLRDFVNSDGQPGYFRQRLFVYGRGGEPCRACGTPIRHAVMGQRSTYWCPLCQS
jgi:formamidopyrimidine-DNA glycosylase